MQTGMPKLDLDRRPGAYLSKPTTCTRSTKGMMRCWNSSLTVTRLRRRHLGRGPVRGQAQVKSDRLYLVLVQVAVAVAREEAAS